MKCQVFLKHEKTHVEVHADREADRLSELEALDTGIELQRRVEPPKVCNWSTVSISYQSGKTASN